MKLLADTHAVVWYVQNDASLSATAQGLIHDPANDIYISPASYWELAIKISVGKIALHQPFDAFVDLCLRTYGFRVLPIKPKHAAALIGLPFHHKDPFDRLLVAQAQVEGIPIVSADAALDPYPITRLW